MIKINKKLKSSKYNLFIDTKKKEEIFLYNTLTGSILAIDKELQEALQDNELDSIPENVLSHLLSIGIVVDQKIDELKIIEYKNNEINYTNQIARFSLIPTYSCPLSCSYCYEGSGTIISKSMDSEMVDRVIEFIKRYVIERGIKNLGITLYGGEPLIARKQSLRFLKEITYWSKNNKINLSNSMITNGVLVTKEVAQEFAPYLNMVQITLDGPKKFHDARRVTKSGKGTYDLIINAVKQWRKYNVPVSLRIQIAKDNYLYSDDLFKDLMTHGFHDDRGIMTYAFPLMELNSLCAADSDLYIKDEEELTIMPHVWESALKFGFTSVVQKPNPTFKAPYCSFANVNTFLIDSFGDLYKCVSVVGEKEFRVGHINKDALLSPLEPEFYAFQTRDPLKIEKCRECVYMPLCYGGCANRARIQHGTYQAPDCILYEGLKDEQVKLYLKNKYPDKF